MANDAERARFWADLFVSSLPYPDRAALRYQLDNAVFDEFCQCGCNSFRVRPLKPLSSGSVTQVDERYTAIFEADYRLADSGKSLEIILFADALGNLRYVEIDCNGNSEQVPEDIQLTESPYQIWSKGDPE